jgi:flagellin
MALAVNNNTSAFNVFTNYTNNIGRMRSSMSRLSSGVKGVTDDPSGLGISERMRSQIRSTSMSRQNVENGLSMLQTADSWLQKINDMLSRMHELGVEAGDGTKTDTDLSNIQSEFKELQSEIRRVTTGSTAAAKYNGLYLFRGGDGRTVNVSTKGLSIQIGADIGQKVKIDLKQLDTTAANTDNLTYTTASGGTSTMRWGSMITSDGTLSVRSADSIGKISAAIDHIANSRATLGAQQNRLKETQSGLLAYEDNLRSAESKVRDVDMASESTKFSKYQILSQISNAMLAQANQLPSSSLQLLG